MLLNVYDVRLLTSGTGIGMMSLVDSSGKLHLSSSALGAADDRDEAHDEANGGQGPPEPCEGVVIIITCVGIIAISIIATPAAVKVALTIVVAACAY